MAGLLQKRRMRIIVDRQATIHRNVGKKFDLNDAREIAANVSGSLRITRANMKEDIGEFETEAKKSEKEGDKGYASRYYTTIAVGCMNLVNKTGYLYDTYPRRLVALWYLRKAERALERSAQLDERCGYNYDTTVTPEEAKKRFEKLMEEIRILRKLTNTPTERLSVPMKM